MIGKFLYRNFVPLIPVEVRNYIAPVLPKKFMSWYVVESSDVFLISFPKCGRTWLRLMIGNIFSEHFQIHVEDPLDLAMFGKANNSIPKISVVHDDVPQEKSPSQLERNKSKYQNSKIIFLVRDPRDVIVSLFFHKKFRAEMFNGDISDYVAQDVGGIDTIIDYYNIWEEQTHVPKEFLLVRYEDLHTNAKLELIRILGFLGIEGVSEKVIIHSVEAASFSKMKKAEKNGEMKSERLKAGKNGVENSYKVREGKVGGYSRHLKQDEIALLDKCVLDKLAPYFGYTASKYK